MFQGTVCMCVVGITFSERDRGTRAWISRAAHTCRREPYSFIDPKARSRAKRAWVGVPGEMKT